MVELNEGQKRIRVSLVATVFVILVVFLIGLFWLASAPVQSVTLTLAFAAGLSMIVLPCTLPLVFIIVPLSMGKGYMKGLGMALFFGLGVIITLMLYGVLVAWLGQIFGLMKIVMYMFLVAGIAAFVFALTELRLLNFKIPSYTGALPRFVQEQGDYVKAFLMGLLLGNAGIGCPNPATYIILAHIATVGNIPWGIALQAVNGLGRVLPLLAFAILGILGVNASSWLVKKEVLVHKITGFLLLFFGAIIIVWGLYGHFWFLNTPLHAGWTRGFLRAGAGAAEYECCIDPPCKQCLTDKMFPNNSCLCRLEFEKGNLDGICGECRKGLAEGRGVYDIANRTQGRAFIIITLLTIIPTVWYFIRRPFG
ncbi:hypothetical protein A3D23_03540 [candidate division WOR-1 bacterium RIFCSPHIGHO2_02_FULL_53_26]|nr:MAG: hypothetical protein A3D23_03540 [candidate division WOR-1 bacterium RIFCSPHIGHO2_02_FULL_53_26]